MSQEPRYSTDPEALRKEVKITTFRSGGPGGQHRNKVESAVRLVHIPSGIAVVATESRFQGRNRELAFQRLRERLVERNRRKKTRHATGPSRAARARRLDRKRRQARKKSLRRRVPSDSER